MKYVFARNIFFFGVLAIRLSNKKLYSKENVIKTGDKT